MIRWSYLAPRLIILALILLAFWISADPLLKYAIVKSTESVTGSKVEVGQVKSSLLKGKVFIKDLAISDPRNPMKNLVQADVAYLQLDPRRLLHRELVIEHGHSTKVVFGSPRTESGKLPNREYSLKELESWLPATIKDDARRASQNWIDKLETSVTSQAEKHFEFLKVSKRLQEKWPKLFDQQRSKITAMQTRLGDLKRKIETPLQNPLRDMDKLADAIQEVNQLNKMLVEAKQQMVKLVESANEDLDKVTEAKKRDAEKIEHYVVSTIDADTFSSVLLGQEQSDRLQEVLNWVQWFRHSIPDPETDFYPARHRGTDIAFQGQKQNPRFLIKTLELDGQGTLSGQHLDFSGVAKNLTTQPQLHDQPATFELRAQGQHHLLVNCTLDRRNDVWSDQMQIKCSDLDMPEQTLGDGESMVVLLRPSQMQVDVDIQISGDELSGQLTFHHSNCSLYVNKLDDYAGGNDMRLRMNQELAQVQQFSTYATLGGTLEQPSIKFSSDLGGKFAATMNRILKGQAEEKVAGVQRKLNQRFQSEIQNLNQMLRSNFAEIAQRLEGETTIVSDLINNIPEPDTWPRIRR